MTSSPSIQQQRDLMHSDSVICSCSSSSSSSCVGWTQDITQPRYNAINQPFNQSFSQPLLTSSTEYRRYGTRLSPHGLGSRYDKWRWPGPPTFEDRKQKPIRVVWDKKNIARYTFARSRTNGSIVPIKSSLRHWVI